MEKSHLLGVQLMRVRGHCGLGLGGHSKHCLAEQESPEVVDMGGSRGIMLSS